MEFYRFWDYRTNKYYVIRNFDVDYFIQLDEDHYTLYTSREIQGIKEFIVDYMSANAFVGSQICYKRPERND